MDLRVERAGNVAVVVVPVQELDSGNSEEFKRALAPVLEADTKVLIDLSGVRFIDSSGLGCFLSCLRKLNAGGGRLELCGLSKQVRTVIELVGMHRILDVFATREEAVSAFAAWTTSGEAVLASAGDQNHAGA
jgi:anti-sigma B factor antagonist